MPILRLGKKDCSSVFSLNGKGEDSATYAIGWGLVQSYQLINLFIQELGILDLSEQDIKYATVDLQKHSSDNGFTDIEVSIPNKLHIIIEAKLHWELPGSQQLEKYCSRFDAEDNGAIHQLLVTLSATSKDYALQFQGNRFNNYDLHHLSWEDMHSIVQAAYGAASGFTEKLWLTELSIHLKGYRSMTETNDNGAYCVVISNDPISDDSSYTWLDVITQDKAYFHPMGLNGWPSTPPNYLAFRQGGKLLSVHHVDSYRVSDKMSELNASWPKTKASHLVYSLGPPMVPVKPIKNGKLYATGRYWCAIDTLLSGAFDTISAARDETQRRS